MKARTRSIATILLGSGIVFLGYGLMVTVLPIRAQMEGFGETAIGLMGSAYFVGFVLGCLLGPGMVKAVGHTRAFAGFAALVAALALVFPLAVDPWLWMALRFISGICLAVVYMVIESWLNEQATNRIRGVVLSVYIIVGNLTTIGGQQMVVLYDAAGLALFSLVSILIAISLVPVSLTPVNEPEPIPSARLRIARLYRLSPTGFVGCILVGLADGAFWTFGPVFAQDKGLPVQEIALFMGAFMAGGTVLQWPLGWLSDRIDRRIVVAICAAGSVATGLALAFWEPQQSWMALALALAHGGVMIPIYALCIAHANDFAPHEEMVEVSSGLLLLYGVGAAVGPIVIGPIMEKAGHGSLFVMIAATFAALALFAIYRIGIHRVAEQATRGQFAPVPKSSPSVYALEADDEDEAEIEELGK
ncbi:MFS transporter [Pacificispira sp.]|uniref:MFS transporter n=1 Tax=Pacificispira sp. TaxID=2888761 RepID=UPI003B51EE6C